MAHRQTDRQGENKKTQADRQIDKVDRETRFKEERKIGKQTDNRNAMTARYTDKLGKDTQFRKQEDIAKDRQAGRQNHRIQERRKWRIIDKISGET